MKLIGEEGRGVVVLIREPLPTSLSDAVSVRAFGKEQGTRKLAAAQSGPRELRDYGVGAQILLDLGVRRMVLLTNHKKTIIGLEGYGLSVEGERAIPFDPS
jgi:3,4-dihydroxy 2-butanone 4-phosphate synthase/GTP cyclohydrolase II